MICQMFLLVSPLFQEYIDPLEYANLLDIRIRLFLSAFDCLDLATRTSRDSTPRWVTSYNFMCLLNIPNIVRRFGPFRNLYEGKYCGEAFNRVLKPMANRGSHRNRCNNLMQNLLREKAMSAIKEKFEEHHCNKENGELEDIKNGRSFIYRMAHRYQTRRKMVSHYHKNLPLSLLVYIKDGERCYGISYIRLNEQYYSPIVRDMNSEIVIGGVLKYWHWDLVRSTIDNSKLDTVKVVDYAILLPLKIDPLHPDCVPPPNYYTITTYVWNSESSLFYV